MALGGCSLSDPAPGLEEEVEVTTLVVLLLLKTCPSAESASSSKGTTTTPLPLTKGLVLRQSRPRRGAWPLWEVESLECELEKEEFVDVLYEMGLGGERLGKWEQVQRLGVWSPQLPWTKCRPWLSRLGRALAFCSCPF